MPRPPRSSATASADAATSAAPDPRWAGLVRARVAAGLAADAALAPAVSAAARARGLDPTAVATLLPSAEPDPAGDAAAAALPPPAPAALGALFQQALDAAAPHRFARKATGAIFTPPDLARALAARALRDRPDPARVLDPAVGAGALLLGVLDVVDAATAPPDRRARRRDLVARLHGVDSDRRAVHVCRAALWLAADDPHLDPADLTRRIVHGDALLGTLGPADGYPRAAFDRAAGDAGHAGPHRPRGARDAALARFRARLAAGTDAAVADSAAVRDAWCALWFWPADALDELCNAAGRPLPLAALAENPRCRAIAAAHAFLHWDLAFAGGCAFDLVIANPPWDTDRPDARNFFLDRDTLQRRRSSTEARSARRALCARDPALEDRWLDHLEAHRQRRHWFATHATLAGPAGDPNQACRFLDRGLELLAPGGRLAMWLPAALHGDLGWTEVRRALLERATVRALIGFENRDRLIPGIDGRFKFDALVVDRGAPATAIETAFLCRSLDALQRGARHSDAATLTALSPRSLVIPELRCDREARILAKLHAGATPFGARDTGWRIALRREFDLTLDADRFVTRPAAEADGAVVDRHDRWLQVAPRAIRAALPADPHGWIGLRDGRACPVDAVRGAPLVPLHEGRMIDVHDDAAKLWAHGHGRGAAWRAGDAARPALGPRVLVADAAWRTADGAPTRSKVGFMAIGSATNRRTMIAAPLWRVACGNSVPTLRARPDAAPAHVELVLAAVLGSLAYDFALRTRLAGLNLNRFTLAETPLPDPAALFAIPGLRLAVATLAWRRPAHAAAWATFDERLPDGGVPHPAVGAEPARRRALMATLDAVVAHAYGLAAVDLGWLLRDCAAPAAALRRAARGSDRDPRGYWRIDRELPPGERRTVWAVAALTELEAACAATGDAARAVAAFVRGRDGLGWIPPASLDLGALGFDAPAGRAPTGAVPTGPAVWPTAERETLVAELASLDAVAAAGATPRADASCGDAP